MADPNALDTLQLGALIGRGHFGRVYRGTLNSTPVAVKVLDLEREGDAALFEREYETLRDLGGLPNIVSCYSLEQDPGCATTYHLVMELMAGGDLHEALYDDIPITWRRGGRDLALQIADGLHQLHSHTPRKVVHCDLKPHNILLNHDRTLAKIGDVGLSRFMSDNRLSTRSAPFGTFHYCAPEVLHVSECTEKIDIFSFGVLLCEMVTKRRPQRQDLYSDLQAVKQRKFDPLLFDLISSCLDSRPAKRPTALEVFNRLSRCIHPPRLAEEAVTDLLDDFFARPPRNPSRKTYMNWYTAFYNLSSSAWPREWTCEMQDTCILDAIKRRLTANPSVKTDAPVSRLLFQFVSTRFNTNRPKTYIALSELLQIELSQKDVEACRLSIAEQKNWYPEQQPQPVQLLEEPSAPGLWAIFKRALWL